MFDYEDIYLEGYYDAIEYLNEISEPVPGYRAQLKKDRAELSNRKNSVKERFKDRPRVIPGMIKNDKAMYRSARNTAHMYTRNALSKPNIKAPTMPDFSKYLKY